MRGILRAMRVTLAAMRRVILRTAQVGGRLVSMFVPAPDVPAVPPDLDELAEVEHTEAETLTKYDAVKRLAASIDHADPELIRQSGGPDVSRWLSAMSPIMRAKVAMASSAELSDHMRGRQVIQSVLAYDPETVAAYRRAMALKPTPSVDELDTVLARAMAM